MTLMRCFGELAGDAPPPTSGAGMDKGGGGGLDKGGQGYDLPSSWYLQCSAPHLYCLPGASCIMLATTTEAEKGPQAEL